MFKFGNLLVFEFDIVDGENIEFSGFFSECLGSGRGQGLRNIEVIERRLDGYGRINVRKRKRGRLDGSSMVGSGLRSLLNSGGFGNFFCLQIERHEVQLALEWPSTQRTNDRETTGALVSQVCLNAIMAEYMAASSNGSGGIELVSADAACRASGHWDRSYENENE